MQRTSAVWTVLLLTAAGLFATAPAANAASSVYLYDPQGSTYKAGETVWLDGYNESGSGTDLGVHCDRSPSRSVRVESGWFYSYLGSYAAPDACRIVDVSSGDVIGSFTVVVPPAIVSDPTVDGETFYPLVRDGYRDTVTFGWNQDYDGSVAITVHDHNSGTLVERDAVRGWQGRNDWKWNGQDETGSTVPAGRYDLSVTLDGETTSIPVLVATRMTTRTFKSRKEGNQGVKFATRGNCYASRDSFNLLAHLECWSGRYAKAKYVLAIPANAKKVRGTIDLLRNDLDSCCHGRISKGWTRQSKRKVVLWARVTNWRATTVNFVRVTYKAKVRI